jgi:hypothetical protein
MRKLMMFWASMLLVGVAPVAAQNTVDVLGGGPQPPNTTACISPFTHCILANWSTTSNANPTPANITTKITANFVFVPNGGGVLTDFPAATSGRICLADTRDLPRPTLFAQIADNCKLAGGVALLLIRDAGRRKRLVFVACTQQIRVDFLARHLSSPRWYFPDGRQTHRTSFSASQKPVSG